jgi:hypothetical protein
VAQSAEEGGREIEHRRPLAPHTGRRAGSSLTVVWRLFPVPRLRRQLLDARPR